MPRPKKTSTRPATPYGRDTNSDDIAAYLDSLDNAAVRAGMEAVFAAASNPGNAMASAGTSLANSAVNYLGNRAMDEVDRAIANYNSPHSSTASNNG